MAAIPWIWCSFPNSDPYTSSWGRYSPYKDDRVKIVYDYDNTPYIVGYDIIAPNDENFNKKQYEGYSLISDIASERYPLFKELNPGEFDFKSSGDAYIYGSDSGLLFFGAGVSSISLNKPIKNIAYNSYLHKFSSTTSYLRFGQVRRTLPGTATEEPESFLPDPSVPVSPWNPTYNGTEFNLHISNPINGIDVGIVDFVVGNVAGSGALDSIVKVSTFVPPGRIMWSLAINDLNSGLIPRYTEAIDEFGNVNIEALIATDHSINMPLCSFDSTYKNSSETVLLNKSIDVIGQVAINSKLTMDLSTKTILTLTGNMINLDASKGATISINGAAGVSVESKTLIQLSAPQVAIGPAPVGGVLNGDVLGIAISSSVYPAVAAIMTAGASAPFAAPVAAATAAAFSALIAAFVASTSKTVMVSL
jgi:hypothetical protein